MQKQRQYFLVVMLVTSSSIYKHCLLFICFSNWDKNTELHNKSINGSTWKKIIHIFMFMKDGEITVYCIVGNKFFIILSRIVWLPRPVVIYFYNAYCEICKHGEGNYKFRFKSSKYCLFWLFYCLFCASIRFNILQF